MGQPDIYENVQVEDIKEDNNNILRMSRHFRMIVFIVIIVLAFCAICCILVINRSFLVSSCFKMRRNNKNDVGHDEYEFKPTENSKNISIDEEYQYQYEREEYL